MRENERMLKYMSVGDVLDYSIAVYKRNFKSLTALSLIFFVPFSLITALLSTYSVGNLFDFTKYTEDFTGSSAYNSEMLSSMATFYAGYSLIMLLLLVYAITLKPVMDASIIQIVYSDVVHQRTEKMKSAIGKSFQKFGSLVASKVLYYLILFGVSIGMGIVLFIVAMIISVVLVGVTSQIAGSFSDLLPGAVMGIVMIIFIILLYIGLIVGYFYFILRFGLGVQSVVIENKTATEGLSRSLFLTKKNFWRLFFAFLFGSVLFFLFPALLSYAATLLGLLHKALFVAGYVLGQMIYAIVYPFVIVLMTMIFINLKVKKEGLDLEVKVDRMFEEMERQDQNISGVANDVD